MAFIEKLNEVAKNIGDKTNDAIEKNKLNGKIADEEKTIKALKYEVGEFYYSKHLEGLEIEPDISETIEKIDKSNQTIAELKEQIETIEREAEEKIRQAEEAKARAEEEARLKAEEEAKAKAQVEEEAKAKVQAAEEAKAQAEDNAQAIVKNAEAQVAEAEKQNTMAPPQPIIMEPVVMNSGVENVASNDGSGIVCQSCGNKNESAAKFCGECGSKLEPVQEHICKSCGSHLPKGAKFCGDCGTKVD